MPELLLPNLADPSFKARPYPWYARLRAEAPACRTRLPDGQYAWLISRYDDVAAALRDPRLVHDPRNAVPPGKRAREPWVPGFAKPLTQNMLDLDEPDHTRLRAIVQKVFTPRTVEQLRPKVETLCDRLLNAAQRERSCDLVTAYALPVPSTIIAEMLGIPASDRARFSRWSNMLMEVTTLWERFMVVPRLWLFVRYLRRLIALRRRDPRDDLISGLVQAEEQGDRLSPDEVLAMVFILLIAGYETTVNLIASGTLALLEHPDQLDRLRQEPSLLRPAVEELLRYTSPLDVASERYAREDVEIAGKVIPRGEQVLLVIGSANHDEHKFADPDHLDIARQPNEHLAFGQGRHYCLGAPLARLEGGIAVEMLVRRLPDLRLARPAESIRWRRGLNLRGPRELPLIW